MSAILGLAARSAWNRRHNLVLMVIAIALSTAMLLGVERLRHQIRQGFSQSISGTDLVVGARGSPTQLMLYTVFRLGSATNNMTWSSVQRLASHPLVAWTIPMSLGDSHRGFPVLATTTDYFRHYQYGDRQPLRIADGRPGLDGIFDTVLGAEVARRLGYRLGDKIVLGHGSGLEAMGDDLKHADKPFIVTGILAPTGTPVDRTVHIGLAGMEAIHLDWQAGVPIPGMAIPAELVKKFDLTPKTVTGVLVGLKLRSRAFAVQSQIAEDQKEPLMAVLPGVALDELWDIVGMIEKGLLLMSWMVVAVGLAGLMSSILAALGERRRELAILRAMGARPRDVLMLLVAEGVCLMLVGTIAGYLLLSGVSFLAAGWLASTFGMALPVVWPQASELPVLAAIIAAGALASLWPAFRAYRISLSDGMTPHL